MKRSLQQWNMKLIIVWEMDKMRVLQTLHTDPPDGDWFLLCEKFDSWNIQFCLYVKSLLEKST